MGGIKRNRLKQWLRSLSRLKSWQLVIIIILLSFTLATLWRLDNIRMFELRDTVQAADESGDMEEMLSALTELRKFVFTHTVIAVIEENGVQRIVLGSGPFYLERQYERTARAELEKAEQALAQEGDEYANIYREVSDYCDELARRYGWRSWTKPHLDCYINKLYEYPSMGPIIDLKEALIPATALYFHNYASPLWTTTPAGIVTIILIILIVIWVFRIFGYLALLIAIRLTRGRGKA